MFTSSGSTGRRGGDAKTIISPNTSFGDIINVVMVIDTSDHIYPLVKNSQRFRPTMNLQYKLSLLVGKFDLPTQDSCQNFQLDI